MAGRYQKRSRISDKQYRRLVVLFCQDLTASQIAGLTGLNRNSVNHALTSIWMVIAAYCEATSPLSGEVEIDENYFGPRRVRGVRGRGAGKKIIVFGLLKRGGNVYPQVVPNVTRDTLKQIVQAQVEPDSTIYSDGWKSYDGLVDWGYKRHYRVNHGANEFARGHSHINGIENFWGIAKVRLAKLRGLRQDHFNLHLKECEFRYNMRHGDMYHELLKLLRRERKRGG